MRDIAISSTKGAVGVSGSWLATIAAAAMNLPIWMQVTSFAIGVLIGVVSLGNVILDFRKKFRDRDKP